MMRLFLSLLVALIGTQTMALSCMEPSVTESFTRAAEAEESYVVLLGRFDFSEPEQRGYTESPQTVTVNARFRGQGLGPTGFEDIDPRQVSLTFTCAGPWCGSLSPRAQTLAFARKTENQYEVIISPCGNWAFPNPTRAMIRQTEACMRDGACQN